MRRNHNRGFTLIELLMVMALIGILSALVAPFLIAAKASSNEASAIGSLRAVNSAESAYSGACGSGGYSDSIPALVADRFLSPDMGFNPKSGYTFVLAGGASGAAGPLDCAGNPSVLDYYATGTPVSGVAGTRAFATDEQATVWQDSSGVPPVEPFATAGTVSTIQ